MPYYPPSSSGSFLPLAGGTMTGTITHTPSATLTANAPILTATQTWNNAAVTFQGIFVNITATAKASASKVFDLQIGGTSWFSVDAAAAVRAVFFSVDSGAGGSFNVGGTGTANSKVFSDGTVLGLAPAIGLKWGASNATASYDTGIVRTSAGLVEVNSGTTGTYRDLVARTLMSAPSSANGQSLNVKSLTELTTIAASANTDTTIQLPANAIILAVSVRVTTAITCTSTFTVGDSGSATRFSTAAVSKAVNSTDAGTKAGAYYNSTATSVRITPDTTPTDATGRLRVTIHYIDVTVPTS